METSPNYFNQAIDDLPPEIFEESVLDFLLEECLTLKFINWLEEWKVKKMKSSQNNNIK